MSDELKENDSEMVGNGKIYRAQTENQKLADLVTYQESSVVSRTIIDKKSGTVTLFAFDQDQGLSVHTVSFDALVFILDGEVKITISDESYRLKEGEMIIMPANQPHALKVVSKFKMLLIMIRSS